VGGGNFDPHPGTTVPLGPKNKTFFSQNNTFVRNNQAHSAGGCSNFDLHIHGVTHHKYEDQIDSPLSNPLILSSDTQINKIE